LGTESNGCALVVLLGLAPADRDCADYNIAVPDHPRARARHDGRPRYLIHLREQGRPRPLQLHQLTAVAVEQCDAGCLRRRNASRQRRRTVHAIENLQVPTVVDDRDRDSRTEYCGVFAHTEADGPGFVQSE
jgi:hypothetical protein